MLLYCVFYRHRQQRQWVDKQIRHDQGKDTGNVVREQITAT
jgi:hypothetical protein